MIPARWGERGETHANPSPESAGYIERGEYYLDRLVVERVPLPRVDVLLHGEPPSKDFLVRLVDSRLKAASAVWAPAENVLASARDMTELRGPDYVAFIRTDTVLARDWLNELVDAIERTPDIAAASLTDPPDARCTLVAARKFPQHVRIKPHGSFDASVAAWLRDAAAIGRAIVRPPDARLALPPATPPVEPFVSIVMLSYNAPEYTEVAVDSIRGRTSVPHEIIIIDNGSGPDTLARLQKIPGIQVVYNAVNTGFAYGCNQGIAAARGTHVVLLNNDVVVTDGWLEALLAVQRAHPTVGCSAPRSNKVAGSQELPIAYRDLAELPAFAAARAREHRGQWTYQARVMGLCMCLDRRVIDEIGGLDTRYGTGNFEDDDYCMRIRAAGYDIAVCDDSFIHHFGSVSFKANKVDYAANLQRNAALLRSALGRRGDRQRLRPAPAPAPRLPTGPRLRPAPTARPRAPLAASLDVLRYKASVACTSRGMGGNLRACVVESQGWARAYRARPTSPVRRMGAMGPNPGSQGRHVAGAPERSIHPCQSFPCAPCSKRASTSATKRAGGTPR